MALTKPMRITEEANEIALRYGESVSKGVVEMQFRIRKMEIELGQVDSGFKPASNTAAVAPAARGIPAGVSFAVPELEAGMTKEYWKRLRKEMDEALLLASRGF